jgi:hypothetical protein
MGLSESFLQSALLKANQSHRIDAVVRSATFVDFAVMRPCSIGWFHGAKASIVG